MENKQLIILAYDFPPSQGGIARLCYEIAIGQKAYYEEIIVMTRKKIGMHYPLKSKNFQLYELPSKRIYCDIAVVRLLRTFNKQQSIILTALWYPEAFLALLSGHRNIYSLAHGAELQPGKSFLRKHIWQKIFGQSILKSVKMVISNSHFTKKLVENMASKANVEALPLGVDTEQFKPINIKKQDNVFVISSLSRIHRFKGYDEVLEALCQLPKETQSKITWHIGGTGPYLNALKDKINNTPKYFTVDFKGFIPDEKLVEFYNQSHLFILFTQDLLHQNNVEGFGLVFLEAQACGVPVIGTNTGGIPDAIESNNGGWLIEQNDIGALAEQILVLMNNPQLLNDQALKAREKCIQKSSWNIYNNNLFKLINDSR